MKKQRDIENVPLKIKEFLQEYRYEEDIFTEDTERGQLIKKVVQELPDVERIVFLLYVELGSLTKVAKILGVSRSTVFWEEKKIKEKILKRYKELC